MARTIPDPTVHIPGSSKRPARSRSSRISRQSDRMGHEVRQQRHELRHDRYHAGHRTAATKDVATLSDVGTAVYGEGHSRPAQPHSTPTTAAGENAPRQDIPLEWVRCVERLHRLPAHAGVPQHRWGVFLNDFDQFIHGRGGWAERAADLGWDTLALFGCHPTRPLDHLNGAGLLWR